MADLPPDGQRGSLPQVQGRALAPEPGEIWQRRDGSRIRIQGPSLIDRDWFRVREVGGDRSRASYPLTAFTNGSFTKAEEGG